MPLSTIPPAGVSTGAPTWDTSGNLTVSGNETITGRILANSQPAFNAKYGSGVWTSVYNNGNNFSTATGRFTAPIDGKYFFSTSMLRDSGSAILDIEIQTSAGVNVSKGRNSGSGVFGTVSCAAVAYLTSGQYVSVVMSGGSVYSDSTWNNFTGYLIG